MTQVRRARPARQLAGGSAAWICPAVDTWEQKMVRMAVTVCRCRSGTRRLARAWMDGALGRSMGGSDITGRVAAAKGHRVLTDLHVHHFTIPSLSRLPEQQGYRFERLQTYSFEHGLLGWG